MIDRLVEMPIEQVRKILKNDMAKQSVQIVAGKQHNKTSKAHKKGFRRSTYKQIALGVEIAIPLLLEGASIAKVMKETRQETGRALDIQIIKRLLTGKYSHHEKAWTVDFMSKTWTGPNNPAVSVASAAGQDSDAIRALWERFQKAMRELGVTSINMREDGSLSIIKTETIIIPS